MRKMKIRIIATEIGGKKNDITNYNNNELLMYMDLSQIHFFF